MGSAANALCNLEQITLLLQLPSYLNIGALGISKIFSLQYPQINRKSLEMLWSQMTVTSESWTPSGQ